MSTSDNSIEVKHAHHDPDKYNQVDTAEHVNLNANKEGKIQNPLKGIPREQLMRDVEAFCQEKGLEEHVLILKKGALVAQNPHAFEEIDGEEALTAEEKDALTNEVLHKWRLPWRLYLTIITCSIGAAVQGWDQTGINGATIFYPKVFGIPNTTNGSLLEGTINSAPYISTAVLGCWLSDPLNNYFGRRGTIFISAQFLIWPVIGSGFVTNWQELLVTRLLMGIGMGIKGSTVPIFAAENSPAPVRGALVMSWQMWTAFGIFLGTVINVAVYYSSINWRLMLGAPFIPAVPLALLIYVCPESPRWLMKKNRYAKAWKSLTILRHNPIQVARDMYAVHAQIVIEQEVVGNSTYLTRAVELFTIPRIRRATIAAFTVMLAQQLCGINIIAFYSTTVFSSAGFTDYQALLTSLGFGAVNWLFAFPAFFTIDSFGRRALLLFTFPNMFWSLLAAALSNLATGTTRLALVATFVYIFAAFYSPGEGPVPFAYSAEVFPLSHREVGMAFAVATCLGWAAVLGITFPLILNQLDVIGAFGLYAGFNVLAFVMIFFLLPETKQRTLEELDYVFAVPNRTFAHYQLTKAAPWWIKRYVLFQRSAKLEPLYTQDDVDVRQAILAVERTEKV
ncbi:sugar transporter-domain-containing protein [Xylariaceae sp. FL1019]|nr:sugar transporter-domain-containing protein [Xylariaceae sp. FL1019]